MRSRLPAHADRALLMLTRRIPAPRIVALGRGIAGAGVVLPLGLIGLVKFTQFEVDALRPLITATPWLAWLYPALGERGAAALLGIVEIATAALLTLSIWSPRAGLIGGSLAVLTFATTVSIMLAIPIWEEAAGGFPWINATGQFLLKDVALLGISLVVVGNSLARLTTDRRPRS
jgi:reactive chlorine resistance protein C